MKVVALTSSMALALGGCGERWTVLDPEDLYRHAPSPKPEVALEAAERLGSRPSHKVLMELLRRSERMVVVEVEYEAGDPEYEGYAWGFSNGEILALSRDGASIELRSLNRAQRDRFEQLLQRLPEAALAQRRGKVIFDNYTVFTWAIRGGRLIQGFKANPEAGEHWPGETPHTPELPEDRWIMNVLVAVRPFWGHAAQPGDKSHSRRNRGETGTVIISDVNG